MTNRTWIPGLIVFGFASWAIAAETSFRFTSEIRTPDRKQDELISVFLDSDQYDATRTDFADLLVIDDQLKPVPFIIRKGQTTETRTVRNTWTAGQFSMKPREGGSLEITLQLGEKDPHPNGLRLVTPLRDFEQRVVVETSDDGLKWEANGSETLIFDYSRHIDVRQESIAFPETSRKRIRIIIENPTVEQESELLALTRRLQGKSETERTEKLIVDRRPFRIDHIELWRETTEPRATGDEKAKYPVIGMRVEQITDKHQTVVSLDSRREPLTTFIVETPDRNFSRRVVVEAAQTRGNSTTWRKLGEATLSRIDFKNLKREELKISFPESRETQYRLVFENQDSTPLQVSRVRAEGNVYQLVILATPNRKYRLAYGSENAKPVTLDTAAIHELLRSGFQPTPAIPEHATLAAGEISRPGFRWSTLFNNPTLLISVISMLVAVLGYGLYHAMKRIDKLPRE